MISAKCKWCSFVGIWISGFILLSFNPVKGQSKPWIVPSIVINKNNPLPSDANSIKTGKTLYMTNCSPCHGEKGKGDGPAAAALDPKPTNHTLASVQSETDGSLFYKISEGRNAMPSYKISLTEEKRWSLVNYIKTLGKKS